MKLWTEKDTNALRLLKTSMLYLEQHPSTSLYALLMIVNTLFCFTLFFLFEYHVYGIHLLNIQTLNSISISGFLDHVSHGISIIGIILFSIFSSLFIHATLNYKVINDLKNTPISLVENICYTAHRIQKLFFLSLVFLNYHIITLFDVLSVSPFLSAVQNHAEGQEPSTTHTLSKATPGRLVVPLLLMNAQESFSGALLESRSLIEKKFGSAKGGDISFARIKIFLFALAAVAIIISTYFDAIDTLATCFLSGVIVLSIIKIMEIGLIIYHGCLYSYCTGGESSPFTPEELRLFL